MSSSEINGVIEVRRRRERNAERALRDAKAVEARASALVAASEANLEAFDADLEARVAEFFQRAQGGVDPGALTGMKRFHSERLELRDGYIDAIRQARAALHAAAQATAEAREAWRREMLAAENLQSLSLEHVERERRALNRRAEQEADELATFRRDRLHQE